MIHRAKLLVAVCALAPCLLAACVLASSSAASSRMLIGIYDENQALYASPVRTFGLLRTLRTQVLRVNLYWGGRVGAIPPKLVAPRFDDPAQFGPVKQPSVGFVSAGGEFRAPAQPMRYQYALLQSSEHTAIPALKAGNRSLKAIAYKNAAATISWATTNGADNEFLPAGVGYAFASETHPDWFLTDANGERIESCLHQGRWQMDIGNEEYQAAWIENVAKDLKDHGWDGVMLDDVNASPARHLCGRTIAKYPTDAEYAAAMERFLARVGPALQARGFLVLPNIQIPRSATAPALWAKWISYTSGGVLESWTKTGREASGQLAGDDWAYQQELLRLTSSTGKIFLGLTSAPAGDVRSIRYARASFLLGWDAGASALVYAPGTATDAWSPEVGVEVGKPLRPAYRVGAGWQREFTGGTVLVNPTTAPITVKLDNTYFAPNGTAFSTVTLEPTSGIVLRFPNLVGGNDVGVARRRPRDAANPGDPAYDWSVYDRTVRYAALNRIKIVFAILGSPKWANGGRSLRHAPTSAELEKFAYAAAKRYSGTYPGDDGRILPPVRHWLAWNEPNNPVFLLPQYSRVGGKWVFQAARDYARICNSVYRGVKLTLIRNEQVACGVTAPRGGGGPRSKRPSITPRAFLREAKKAGMRRFDAYAHHPYYDKPNETPRWKPRHPGHVTLGNIDKLLADLSRLYGKNTRLWITEYGYQTWRPDRKFGVSWAKQAKYLTEAYGIARKNKRIDMMLWFLLRDDRRITTGWQSGFFTATGKRKPSFDAFRRLKRSS